MNQNGTIPRSRKAIIRDLSEASSDGALELEKELEKYFRDVGFDETRVQVTTRGIMATNACARGVHRPLELLSANWHLDTRTWEDAWSCGWCGKRQRTPHQAH